MPENPMRQHVVGVAALGLAVLIAVLSIEAGEEKVPLDKVPKPVMDALLSKFPKAKIDKCTKEKEGNDIVYDIEFKQEGRKCEADIKENGTFINYELEIPAKDLPKPVTDAIEKRYPKSTLKEIMQEMEVVEKKEKLAAYEVVLETADKKAVEIKVSPDGKILEDSGAK
jgi:hypothetical protein